jgi:hypothetical protein
MRDLVQLLLSPLKARLRSRQRLGRRLCLRAKSARKENRTDDENSMAHVVSLFPYLRIKAVAPAGVPTLSFIRLDDRLAAAQDDGG